MNILDVTLMIKKNKINYFEVQYSVKNRWKIFQSFRRLFHKLRSLVRC